MPLWGSAVIRYYRKGTEAQWARFQREEGISKCRETFSRVSKSIQVIVVQIANTLFAGWTKTFKKSSWSWPKRESWKPPGTNIFILFVFMLLSFNFGNFQNINIISKWKTEKLLENIKANSFDFSQITFLSALAWVCKQVGLPRSGGVCLGVLLVNELGTKMSHHSSFNAELCCYDS